MGFCCQWLLLPLLAKNGNDLCRGKIQPCSLALICQTHSCCSLSPPGAFSSRSLVGIGQSSASLGLLCAVVCALSQVQEFLLDTEFSLSLVWEVSRCPGSLLNSRLSTQILFGVANSLFCFFVFLLLLLLFFPTTLFCGSLLCPFFNLNQWSKSVMQRPLHERASFWFWALEYQGFGWMFWNPSVWEYLSG